MLHGLVYGWILLSILFLNLGTKIYTVSMSLSHTHSQLLEKALRMGSLKHGGLEEGGMGERFVPGCDAACPREVTSAYFLNKNVWKLCPLSHPP